MSPVHINELNPETRARVLKQIEGGTHENTPITPVVNPLPATVEKETFLTLGDPAEMSNEQLADIVVEGIKKVRQYLPFIRVLKERFDTGDRDSANRLKTPIQGCCSWKEFCKMRLDRAPQTIGEALAGPKIQKVAHEPPSTPLDLAFKTLSPFFGESAACARNVLPTALDWVKQNQPLNAEEIKTLSAVVNLLDQISKLTFQYHRELEDHLRSKSEEVAA